MCLPGYGGQFCDEEIDLCKLSPCLNGGNCTLAKGKYNCNCPAQFVGSRCQALVRILNAFYDKSMKWIELLNWIDDTELEL